MPTKTRLNVETKHLRVEEVGISRPVMPLNPEPHAPAAGPYQGLYGGVSESSLGIPPCNMQVSQWDKSIQ